MIGMESSSADVAKETYGELIGHGYLTGCKENVLRFPPPEYPYSSITPLGADAILWRPFPIAEEPSDQEKSADDDAAPQDERQERDHKTCSNFHLLPPLHLVSRSTALFVI